MNTTLTPTTRQTTTQSTTQATQTLRPERRVGLIDRAALHLGMALIRWGRRPGRELARHERRANRLAHHLRDCGVGVGSTIGCHVHNGTEYLEAMLAAYKLPREVVVVAELPRTASGKVQKHALLKGP